MAGMPAGTPTAPKPAAMPAGGLTVPLTLLQTPDDSDQMQTPQKGDKGECTVGYTLLDVQGDNAIIQPDSINGQDLSGDNPQDTEATDDGSDDGSSDDQEGSDLRTQALNQ